MLFREIKNVCLFRVRNSSNRMNGLPPLESRCRDQRWKLDCHILLSFLRFLRRLSERAVEPRALRDNRRRMVEPSEQEKWPFSRRFLPFFPNFPSDIFPRTCVIGTCCYTEFFQFRWIYDQSARGGARSSGRGRSLIVCRFEEIFSSWYIFWKWYHDLLLRVVCIVDRRFYNIQFKELSLISKEAKIQLQTKNFFELTYTLCELSSSSFNGKDRVVWSQYVCRSSICKVSTLRTSIIS